MRRRLPIPPAWWRSAGLFGLVLASAGVLGHAWHVRHIEVVGVVRFNAEEARRVLREAMGKPPLLAPAPTLRERLLELPWVEEAQVVVELDGTVRCILREREPRAVLADQVPPLWVDAAGQTLGPAKAELPLPKLVGFAPYPEERAEILRLLPQLTAQWGQPVTTCQRLGAREIALSFSGDTTTVILDPQAPEALETAKEVVQAWGHAGLGLVARVDVRVPGRAYVQPLEEGQ
ncbi:MAG: FtsQ-type POTRA domain-containing protein [Thermoanaerobaculum sp.]|nr:FtsQ-type POTRA domain-containing protein [Thermoanaerobaculum sp.]